VPCPAVPLPLPTTTAPSKQDIPFSPNNHLLRKRSSNTSTLNFYGAKLHSKSTSTFIMSRTTAHVATSSCNHVVLFLWQILKIYFLTCVSSQINDNSYCYIIRLFTSIYEALLL
jgi:hypothetical protein